MPAYEQARAYLGSPLGAEGDVFASYVFANAVCQARLAFVLGIVDVLLEEGQCECALRLGPRRLVLDINLTRVVLLVALLHHARYACASAKNKGRVDIAFWLVARAEHVVLEHRFRHPPVVLHREQRL